MNDIDPQQFGKLVAGVENLEKMFNSHANDVKDLIAKQGEDLKAHAGKDDIVQGKMQTDIHRLTIFNTKLTSKWSIVVLILGFISVNVLAPVVRNFVQVSISNITALADF